MPPSQFATIEGALLGLRRLAFLVATASVLAAVLQATAAPAFYPDRYLPVVLAVLALPLALALPRLRTPPGPLAALRAFVLLGTAVSVLAVPLARQPAGSADYSPLHFLVVAAGVVTGIVFPPKAGIPIATLNLVALTMVRGAVVGPAQAIAEALIDTLAFALPFILVAVVRIRLHQSAELALELTDTTAVAHSSLAQAEGVSYFDGLLHDKVLGALRCGAEGNHEAARTLAQDALDRLANAGPLPFVPQAAWTVIEEHARRLGVELTRLGDDTPWPSGDVGRALRAAVNEAVSNVARHTQHRTATVHTTTVDDLFRVEIADNGPGFDPSRVGHDRLGMELSIRQSLEAVGGRVVFASRIGGGTMISMIAPVGHNGPDAPSRRVWTRRWTDGTAQRLLYLVWPFLALATLGYEATAVMHLDSGLSPTVTIVGMAAIVVLPALLHLLRNHDRSVMVIIALTTAVWAALLANMEDPSVADWRQWFVGAFNITLGLLTVYRTRVHALGVVFAANAVGLTILAIRGESFAALMEPAFQSLLVPLVVGWLMGLLNSTADLVVEQRVQVADAVRTAERARTIHAEVSERQRELAPGVIPVLRELAASQPLDDQRRRYCQELMRATRDNLVARTLLTPELNAAIAGARGRGADVLITGRHESGDEPELEQFRQVSVHMLAEARRGDEVILRWGPFEHDYATAVLNSEDAHLLAPATPWPTGTLIDDTGVLVTIPKPSDQILPSERDQAVEETPPD